MALINCHECQAQISTEAAQCPRCGAPTAMLLRDPVDATTCPRCNAPVVPGRTDCPACGSDLRPGGAWRAGAIESGDAGWGLSAWWDSYVSRHYGPVACTRCGHVGDRRSRANPRGPGLAIITVLGIVCLVFFTLVGLALLLTAAGVWLFTSPGSTAVCRACGSPDVVPVDTPQGRRIAQSRPGRPLR